MKSLKTVKHFNNLESVYYSILENGSGTLFLQIKTLFTIKLEKAPFQSSSSLKKYKKMTDKQLSEYIINHFIENNN